MATEAGFAEQLLDAEPKQNNTPMRAAANANKRKRNVADQASPSAGGRGTPTTRRSRLAAHQNDHTPAMAGVPDFSHNPAGDAAGAAFDFSALQQTGNANSSMSAAAAAIATSQLGAAGSDDASTAAAALKFSMTVPPHPSQTFVNEPTAGEGGYGLDDSQAAEFVPEDDSAMDTQGVSQGASQSGSKPQVGSEEWHKLRKDNHKEVERRRRETINEGINELAKIVPGSEKNKGSILQRAVQYITKLHDDATQNIDKWTFEKLITETAIADLSGKLKRTYHEKEAWKKIAKDAGVDIDNVDLGVAKEGPPDGLGEGDKDDDEEVDEDGEDDGEENGNGLIAAGGVARVANM